MTSPLVRALSPTATPRRGGVVIGASYFGDSNNLGSSGATILGNFDPAATAAALTQTSVGDQTGSDQTTATGVATTITGSSSEDGTPVAIFSADLPSLPSGTPIPLEGAVYYYAEVYGIYDGSANVCISNLSVGPATQLDYNPGYGWLAATATTVVSGASICGDVPVSALTGAYLAIGSPLPATTTTVSLSPDSVPSGNPTVVTATVAGANATGTVSWSTDGWGAFSSDTCNLVDSSCSVVFTPYTAFGSPQTITATYGGDSSNAASSGTATLTVLQHSTSTTVSCSPSPGQVGVPTVCTVTVSDTDSVAPFTPTGTVSFSTDNGGHSIALCAGLMPMGRAPSPLPHPRRDLRR